MGERRRLDTMNKLSESEVESLAKSVGVYQLYLLGWANGQQAMELAAEDKQGDSDEALWEEGYEAAWGNQ